MGEYRGKVTPTSASIIYDVVTCARHAAFDLVGHKRGRRFYEDLISDDAIGILKEPHRNASALEDLNFISPVRNCAYELLIDGVAIVWVQPLFQFF